MKRIGRTLGALCIVVLACAATASWAALTASLDRNRAALGDTLRLTITATDDEDIGDLDLGPLQADFEILGRSSSSKTSYINGQFSSSKELLLDITPRREGALTIPALQLGRQSTNALPVVVGPPPKGSTGSDDLVFEAELDRSSVYVQGQVILTLRLQQAINLDDRNITQLELDNAFVRPLEQNSFQRTINGRPWLVHEVRYAIFPEQSGTLEIPAQTFSARERAARRSVFDLGGGGRQVRRSTEPLTIEVLPRPAGYPNADWLPAAQLTLEESWSTPPEQLKVGESATRTITIRGEGLQGAQLPPVMFPPTAGLKFYPDQPVITDGESASGLVGTRVDSVAVVPTQAGHWQVPELRIPWWDTRSNELRYAVLPARELEVTGAAPASAQTAPAPLTAPAVALDPVAPTNITIAGTDPGRWWPLIAVVNGAGWLLTLIYLAWSRLRRRGKPAQGLPSDGRERSAFKVLQSACSNGNAVQARQAVIDWAAAASAQQGLASLAQVAAAFADPAMNAALDSLNEALYGNASTSWDGTALAAAARRLRSSHRRATRSRNAPLQLYPQTG
jgi:hypothetical protein